MIRQITWNVLPGLQGLACSAFRALETQSPDAERGVAVEFASQAQADALMTELEKTFSPLRFSNNASGFETVKSYVLEQAAKNQ